jgi:phage head maturation protease
VIAGLAVPYSRLSRWGLDGKPFFEVIEPGCFRRAVESGLSPKGKPIFACRGHDRRGRRQRLGSTADGTLRLVESSSGIYFYLANTPLPLDFSGVSVTLRPFRWRQEGAVYRLLEAGLVHVALLSKPHKPAYPTWAVEL